MNRKFLAWAVLYGVMTGSWMSVAISPRPETFVIRSGSDGTYPESIEADDFRVQIEDYGDGFLAVTFDPGTPKSRYVVGLMIAVLIGGIHYRNLKNAEKKEEGHERTSVVDSPPSVDPRYEEFLNEDANRRLFPRTHLEGEFNEWQLQRAGRGEDER